MMDSSESPLFSILYELEELITKRAELKGANAKKKRNKLNRRVDKLHEEIMLRVHHRDDCYPMNYVPNSAPGCHVAHGLSDWIISCEPFELEDFGVALPEDLPDIAVAPPGGDDGGLLSLVNASGAPRSVFLTTPHAARGRGGRPLAMGADRPGPPGTPARRCLTVVATVPPWHVMEVARLELPPEGLQGLCLASDIKDLPVDWERPLLSIPRALSQQRIFPFPLETKGQEAFLCSQGFGGAFTHFFPATRYAVDLECPPGTPVLAVGDGVVLGVRETGAAAASGIAVGNLFAWNSVTLRLDPPPSAALGAGPLTLAPPGRRDGGGGGNGDGGDNVGDSDGGGNGEAEEEGWPPAGEAAEGGGRGEVAHEQVFVEYVHVAAGSAARRGVRPGARVRRGQVICESGDVGFCPTPHLHFQVQLSSADDAPTVPFAFWEMKEEGTQEDDRSISIHSDCSSGGGEVVESERLKKDEGNLQNKNINCCDAVEVKDSWVQNIHPCPVASAELWKRGGGKFYFPVAGRWYNTKGECSKPLKP